LVFFFTFCDPPPSTHKRQTSHLGFHLIEAGVTGSRGQTWFSKRSLLPHLAVNGSSLKGFLSPVRSHPQPLSSRSALHLEMFFSQESFLVLPRRVVSLEGCYLAPDSLTAFPAAVFGRPHSSSPFLLHSDDFSFAPLTAPS